MVGDLMTTSENGFIFHYVVSTDSVTSDRHIHQKGHWSRCHMMLRGQAVVLADIDKRRISAAFSSAGIVCCT